jgi:hypothetical protein
MAITKWYLAFPTLSGLARNASRDVAASPRSTRRYRRDLDSIWSSLGLSTTQIPRTAPARNRSSCMRRKISLESW